MEFKVSYMVKKKKIQKITTRLSSMVKFSMLCSIILVLNSPSFAQERTQDDPLKHGTITDQFDYIYRISSNYQDYEVVKKHYLEQIKATVLDSIRAGNEKVEALKSQVATQKDSMGVVMAQLEKEVSEKEKAIKSKNSIDLFGMKVPKAVYSSIMWALVIGLAVSLAFFSSRYFKSFGQIKRTQKDFADLQEEFDQHRRNTLERERKLKRELIDAQMGK